MTELNLRTGGQQTDRPYRRSKRGPGVEDLADPTAANRCARKHHEHEERHHHGHQDLREVHQEGRERPYLHLPYIDASCAEPQHCDGRYVQDENDCRKGECRKPSDPQRRVGKRDVRGTEALHFDRFAHECANDSDTGELLAQHAVHSVDTGLHQTELGNHTQDDDADE